MSNGQNSSDTLGFNHVSTASQGFNQPGTFKISSSGIMFLANTYNGFKIINIANPSNYLELSTTYIRGYISNIEYIESSSILILNNDWGNTLFYMVNNPSDPLLIYELPPGHYFESLNEHYFLTSTTLYDISNPAGPVELNYNGPKYSTDERVHIGADNGMLFISSNNKIEYWNIQVLSNSVLISSFHTRDTIWWIRNWGGVVAIAEGQYGFSTIDLSDPLTPTPTANLTEVAYYTVHFLKSGDNLFTSGSGNAAITNLLNQSLIFTVPTNRAIYSEIYGQFWVISAEGEGILIYDISNLNAISYVNTIIYAKDYVSESIYDNGFLYTTSTFDGLFIYDLADFESPQLVSQLGFGDDAIKQRDQQQSLSKVGDLIYASNRVGMKIINVSNVYNPTIIGSYTTGGYTYDAIPGENIAILLHGSIDILNTSNPSSISLINNLSGDPTGTWTIDLTDQLLAYGSNNFLIEITEISDPSNPIIKSRFGQGFQSGDIKIEYPYAYLAGSNGFTLLDITDLSDPTEVYNWSEMSFGDFQYSSIIANGSYVYITNGFGFHVFNIKDLSNIQYLGHHFTNHYENIVRTVDIEIFEKFIFVSEGPAGVAILESGNFISTTIPDYTSDDLSSTNTKTTTNSDSLTNFPSSTNNGPPTVTETIKESSEEGPSLPIDVPFYSPSLLILAIIPTLRKYRRI